MLTKKEIYVAGRSEFDGRNQTLIAWRIREIDCACGFEKSSRRLMNMRESTLSSHKTNAFRI